MIKKFLLISCFFLFLPFLVSAQEQINNYDVKVDVNNDASILVTETINYNFGEEKKHGIYRDIIYKYKARGGNYKLDISDISVTDNLGKNYSFVVTSEGDYKKIRIGEADKYVSGSLIYKIKYRVEGAINYFDDYDELYWNAIGNKWTVPVKQSKVTVVFPADVLETNLKTTCFAGLAGSNEDCSYTRNTFSSANYVSDVVFINEKLNVGEGLTFVLGLPKGLIVEPSFFAKVLKAIKDNWILFVPVLVFLIMYYLWYNKGRDPQGRETIVAQFNPPSGLSPLEIGTIIDQKVDNFEVSSQIIDFAVRGYIKITKTEKGTIFKTSDYLIEKLKDGSDLKKGFEKKLFDALFERKNIDRALKDLKKELTKRGVEDNLLAKGLFSVLESVAEKTKLDTKVADEALAGKEIIKLSNLKNKFYSDLEAIKKEIYEDLSKRGFFVKNPSKVRAKYVVIGILVLFVIVFYSIFVQSIFGVASGILSGIIVLLFGLKMPARTNKGVLVREHILGLKKYLEVAEKDRIDFHNAPEKNPERFEKLLPYAMALKVEKEWAKQFKAIYKDVQPSWYNDTSMKGFSAIALTNNLNAFSTKSNSTLASSPSSASSGGSGFSGGSSGGGFGGGGGGSW